VDPAHRAAEFPGGCEMRGRRARRNRPARVPLELVPSAEFEISVDRQKPARDALLAGQRVPEVVDTGVVKPCQRHGARGFAVFLEIANRARDQSQHPGDVDLHPVLPVFWTGMNIGWYLYKSRLIMRGAVREFVVRI